MTEDVLIVRGSRRKGRFPEVLRCVRSEATTDPVLAEEDSWEWIRTIPRHGGARSALISPTRA